MANKRADEDRPNKANGDGPSRERQAAELAQESPATLGAARAGNQAQLSVLAQYVKDLSFENPGAPLSLQGPGQNPQLKVGVNVNAESRGNETFEVALHLDVHASNDGGVIYNVELVYGGLFDRGFWVAPFLVSAAVMFAGALIWIFLIDPERSVVT